MGAGRSRRVARDRADRGASAATTTSTTSAPASAFRCGSRSKLADDAEFKRGVTLVVDRTQADVPNPGVAPQIDCRPKASKARYVRVTATKLAPRQNDFIFALAELQVFDAEGKNVAAGAAVTSLDSIEAPVRWRQTNLVDGYLLRRKRQAGGRELDATARRSARRCWRTSARRRLRERDWLDREQPRLPKHAPNSASCRRRNVVYAGTVHHGSGTFVGTGATRRQAAADSRAAPRRCARSRARKSSPGALQLPSLGLPGEFDFASEQHAEGERRAALAQWITDTRQPAHLAEHRQPRLAVPLRPRARRYAQRLRPHGAAADRIPNCSTGWRSSSATAASRSSSCIG